MNELGRGLYETLLDETLQRRLEGLDDGLVDVQTELHAAEAADRLALHVSQLLRGALQAFDDKQRLAVGARLVRDITSLLVDAPGSGVDDSDQLVGELRLLEAICARLPNGKAESIEPPDTPLLDTALLTNAPGEPRVGHQLRSEVGSTERIDVLMAFVRRSGIRPFLDLLRRHCEKGALLRVLTTTYTGSTELEALRQLQALGAEVRVSYDTAATRLHAKAWLFHRASGYSTAYIGSSNLTHSAQVTGLEWNVRVSGKRNPDVIEKFAAVFDSHWESDDFRPFDEDEFRQQTRAATKDTRGYTLSPIELRPEPFQSRLLEQIELARMQGWHRNLLVSAMGTGKTVMAALDYQRLQRRLPRARLLFVAHRREILQQSLATFREALRDAAFGELWVNGRHPERYEHVFASVQSLSATGLHHIAPDQFDVVVVDEFHHAAAQTYNALLSHLKPQELLGLTATPERADGQSILHWFRGRIAAELRVWDAIEQQRLCPFAYYGISAGPDADLSKLRWHRGRGYEVAELDSVFTGNDVLARRVIQQTINHVDDPQQMRALGFCVSVAHAHFMARQFTDVGIAAQAVSGKTPTAVRAAALDALTRGEAKALFAVDLFNEGVDLPAVDTLLLLRPTDSATIFLQQLGRGLRKLAGKELCTVLDFVCQHRKEFQFRNRFGALLGGTRKRLIEQVEQDFPWLPGGCHMELDAVASKIVLHNLKTSLPSTWNAKARELQKVTEVFDRIKLARFLAETGLELGDIYSNGHSWSDLLRDGGLATLPAGPLEQPLRRALGRLLHVDDLVRLDFYTRLSTSASAPDVSLFDAREQRLLHLLVVSLLADTQLQGTSTLRDAVDILWEHPQVVAELGELVGVLATDVQHVSRPLEAFDDVPLMIHARYTRREILAALASDKNAAIPAWREGVRWFAGRKTDVAVFTLDKSGKRFSPTTRYRDYAITRRLIHWESQSVVRASSPTGQRYQRHDGSDTTMLLFARMTPDERAFWFLGPATYVSHEGERPMAIKWRLQHELPGDLFADFAAAV